MKKILLSFVFLLTGLICISQNKPEWVIVIHGGAGNIKPEMYSDADVKLYLKKIDEALIKGGEILENGGTCLDAIEMVIMILEDSPLFNAGKGAVFNYDGNNELDASMMDGKTMKAGAVTGVMDIKNPICAARKVMENSPFVMLAGKGASAFAKEQGLKIVDNSYFFTEERWNQYKDAKEKELQKEKQKKGDIKGTVGCVALDKYGNIAAGTSTGGMTNKRWNRIGDSPVIGAGTYANNNTCAISCTGHGEFFIRYAVAHDISALIEYKNLSLQQACELVVKEKLVKAGGSGGVIGVDKNGNIAMVFNSEGMFRGYLKSDKKKEVFMFK